MRTNGRQEDQNFDDDERLYRRVPPNLCQSGEIEVDAVELPDISTMRDKYTDSIDWVLIDPTAKSDFSGWGVAAFPVRGIPSSVPFRGLETYYFRPVHCPEKNNYPHSEVRAFDEDGNRLSSKPMVIPPECHLKFRERLLRCTKLVRSPSAATSVE